MKEYLEVILKGLGAAAAVVFGLLILGVVIAMFTSSNNDSASGNTTSSTTSTNVTPETEQEKISRIEGVANTPTYKHLKKNPDKYKDVSAVYTGKVIQAQEGDDVTNLRIEVTKGEYGTWDDVIFVVYNGTTDAVEDDIVKVYGTIQGDYEYESQAGWKIHVPRLDAEVIKIKKKSK